MGDVLARPVQITAVVIAWKWVKLLKNLAFTPL